VKHTEESKRKLSESRKRWLKENPDRHPWRSHNKFKSKPCENVKNYFKKIGILFVEEFNPQIKNRNFSIDIALPDKKIAIEINGNQHYEKTGELKPYYKERELLLEKNGWTVYQIHYSACFKFEKWVNFINHIKYEPSKIEFDYFNYQPKSKKQWFCIDCGSEIKKNNKRCLQCRTGSSPQIPTGNISLEEKCDMPFTREPRKFCSNCGNRHHSKTNFCRKCTKSQPKIITCICGNLKHYKAKNCKSCFLYNRRKVKSRPNKEKLFKLINELPFTKIGEMFGVSDNCIRKWCKSHNIF
jgi:very-short-patch-repair endonuclease